MSHMHPTLIRCELGSDLTVEKRIATALWNQDERERFIALKAYEAFCLRGCQHGSDLDDWLTAERELSPEADDVVITHSGSVVDISIAERPQQPCIVLSIAPSSLLILWTGDDTDPMAQNGAVHHSTIALVSLPETKNPETTEVTYHDGRVRLRLPNAEDTRSSLEEEATTLPSGRRRTRSK
jgi:Protein of unknown function (DUF2934)